MQDLQDLPTYEENEHGKLPPKEAGARPWDTLCIDLIGPYTVKKRNEKESKLHCLTTIDPAIGWFEIVEIPNKKADETANLFEQIWLVPKCNMRGARNLRQKFMI